MRSRHHVVESEDEESEDEEEAEEEEHLQTEGGHDNGPQITEDAHDTINTDNFHQNVSKVPSSTPPRTQGISTQATLVDRNSISKGYTKSDLMVKPSDAEEAEDYSEEDSRSTSLHGKDLPHIDQIEHRQSIPLRNLDMNQSNPHTGDEEVTPARSFQMSGSVKRGEIYRRASKNSSNHNVGERSAHSASKFVPNPNKRRKTIRTPE